MDDAAAWLQALGPVDALRRSRWAYPLVNAGHVLGLAALFGAVVLMDLRMLGAWRAIPAATLVRPATAVAATGLLLAALTGVALFATRPGEYLGNGVFAVKSGFVVAGALNAAGGHVLGLAATRPRLVAAVSLASWTGAIVAGRLVGYTG